MAYTGTETVGQSLLKTKINQLHVDKAFFVGRQISSSGNIIKVTVCRETTLKRNCESAFAAYAISFGFVFRVVPVSDRSGLSSNSSTFLDFPLLTSTMKIPKLAKEHGKKDDEDLSKTENLCCRS